jgi:hypothetical protein
MEAFCCVRISYGERAAICVVQPLRRRCVCLTVYAYLRILITLDEQKSRIGTITTENSDADAITQLVVTDRG